ncbi:MAG: DUF3747 domain-containing protein [Cyanobacteria bacterium CRU_2_1]|nr:DUF3747 domain-containing protein [Cyanobacteria bacterium RU_5_0]NJR60735.1 DUF3747 domain-containing protein [Cyanobacteria bacterium CRU_2_1]
MKLSIYKTAAITAATAIFTLFVNHSLTAATFGQQEVDQSRFIAIAAPRSGGTAHQLLILEQISDDRPCWSESGNNPIIVDPLLINFDFTGICGRSTDSNGFSIRVNGEDLALVYSLRVVDRDNDLVLVAASSDRDQPEVEVGRAYGMTAGFARIILNPGWRFTKRTFGDQILGHVYLTYEGSFPPGSVAMPPTPTPPPTTYAFRDISTDIYAEEIQQAVQIGFISGFAEDNTFRPQDSLTREQLVSMVLESLRRLPDVTLNIPTTATGNPYSDVEAGRWSAAKIQFARDNNIVSGYEDGTFRPTQPVTRAEMMAILRRASEYGRRLRGFSPDLQPSQQPIAFSDTSGHWAESLISQMSAYCGIATPQNETGTAFAPNNSALRNYAAAATLRMYNCVGETLTTRWELGR